MAWIEDDGRENLADVLDHTLRVLAANFAG
jgi:hypothetical protein